MLAFLADLVVVLHLLFVVFVLLGGLLVLCWPRVAWIHLPAAAWGAIVELTGWICPLTPLESWLRERGGRAGYRGDFVDQYVMPTLYPDWLTRPTQFALATVVIAVNLAVYGWALRSRRRAAATSRATRP